MPKLIESSLLNKILGFLGGNTGSDKKGEFIKKLRKADPSLAKSFENWESDFLKLLKATRAVKVKNRMDTTEIDRLIKQYS
jgi:hypothetical protein